MDVPDLTINGPFPYTAQHALELTFDPGDLSQLGLKRSKIDSSLWLHEGPIMLVMPQKSYKETLNKKLEQILKVPLPVDSGFLTTCTPFTIDPIGRDQLNELQKALRPKEEVNDEIFQKSPFRVQALGELEKSYKVSVERMAGEIVQECESNDDFVAMLRTVGFFGKTESGEDIEDFDPERFARLTYSHACLMAAVLLKAQVCEENDIDKYVSWAGLRDGMPADELKRWKNSAMIVNKVWSLEQSSEFECGYQAKYEYPTANDMRAYNYGSRLFVLPDYVAEENELSPDQKTALGMVGGVAKRRPKQERMKTVRKLKGAKLMKAQEEPKKDKPTNDEKLAKFKSLIETNKIYMKAPEAKITKLDDLVDVYEPFFDTDEIIKVLDQETHSFMKKEDFDPLPLQFKNAKIDSIGCSRLAEFSVFVNSWYQLPENDPVAKRHFAFGRVILWRHNLYHDNPESAIMLQKGKHLPTHEITEEIVDAFFDCVKNPEKYYLDNACALISYLKSGHHASSKNIVNTLNKLYKALGLTADIEYVRKAVKFGVYYGSHCGSMRLNNGYWRYRNKTNPLSQAISMRMYPDPPTFVGYANLNRFMQMLENAKFFELMEQFLPIPYLDYKESYKRLHSKRHYANPYSEYMYGRSVSYPQTDVQAVVQYAAFGKAVQSVLPNSTLSQSASFMKLVQAGGDNSLTGQLAVETYVTAFRSYGRRIVAAEFTKGKGQKYVKGSSALEI